MSYQWRDHARAAARRLVGPNPFRKDTTVSETRTYIESWTLTHPTHGEAIVYLWDGGEDVTVVGGGEEAFTFGDARSDVVKDLIPNYEADGWAVTAHRDANTDGPA